MPPAAPTTLGCLEVHRHEPQEWRNTEAEIDEALALPRLRPRPIDLEHEQTRSKLGPPLRERIEAHAEDDVLRDAASCLFADEIVLTPPH